MQRFYAESFNAAGGLIYGCAGYEKYVPYSEAVAATGKHAGGGAATEAEVSYATRVSQLPKFVASTTLNDVNGKTTILRSADLMQEVDTLKSHPDGDLLLRCGAGLLAALSADGLVGPRPAHR